MKPSSWAFTITRAYLARATSPQIGGDANYHPVQASRIYVRYEDQLNAVARYMQQQSKEKRQAMWKKVIEECKA